MRLVVMRAVALVALMGQLQTLPGALACVREHRRADVATHCQQPAHGAMPSDGGQVAVQGIPDAAQPLCSLLGPCAAPTPAVAQFAARVVAAGSAVAVTWPVPSAPLSIDLTPQPPPPQV